MTKSKNFKKNKAVIHLKAALARITLTPHTLAFFLLSVIHCVAQGLTAAFIYSEDASSFSFVDSILRTAEVPNNEVARLFRSGGSLTLRLCTAAPIGNVYGDCETIWATDMEGGNETLVPRFLEDVALSARSPLEGRAPPDSSLRAITDPTNGTVTGVLLTFDGGRESVTVSKTCARILEYPARILDNSWREDLALIGSQFWLLGMSTFGILYNSIPHIWAVVFARVMQSSWATYTLWRTGDVQFRYNALITGGNTPCHFDFLPGYFTTRIALQVPELVLNLTALLSTSFLAWRIVKGYSASTIRRVGPPAGVMRIYKFFLVDSMFLQLSLFFTVTAISLWIDQLRNSSIAMLAHHPGLYYALFIGTIVTIVPWMIMGWFAVRREMKFLMAGFLFLNICYIALWSAMFYSHVYRWTFIEWPFFACSTMVSMGVLVGAAIFGTISWVNFGRGLAHYLHVEAVLLESDFNPDVFTNDEEKAPANSSMNTPVQRSPSALSQLSAEGVSVVKKDTNWDFSDVNRPAIYTVDVQVNQGTVRSMDSSMSKDSLAK
ncbi:hypothetical protein L227DRAFT_575013 [Lentinus tigrinus ALCF2SS1-6]|uniref:Transmembrane protein n=1 Tax=Lentinus tigrinus ALCF2SS1-6 TaxID=1328759 RepID=A0A5C2SCG1_9APHY|nr:hypothetical protein L227DRAFT_575013 [Lentinus tigrinus ALCF2SS1-6]